jgi:hypothetical protein
MGKEDRVAVYKTHEKIEFEAKPNQPPKDDTTPQGTKSLSSNAVDS